jgi:hypothetical protein
MLQDVCAYSYVLLRSEDTLRLQLAIVMTCCTNPAHSNKHNSLQRAATEQIEHNMLQDVCAYSYVLLRSSIQCAACSWLY